MENIEVLKLVKRKNNDSYRPVLDLSLVDDIKNYSWWGENDFLYQLFMALIESEILNLLKGVNNKNKVKYRFCTAEVFDNLISIKRYSRLNLEMPIEEFFEFYDEYNRLIKEKAHEIVLRKCEDKISADQERTSRIAALKAQRLAKEKKTREAQKKFAQAVLNN